MRTQIIRNCKLIGCKSTVVKNPTANALAHTGIHSRGADNLDASELLTETGAFTFLDAALGNRKAFANAAAVGMGVTEVKPKDKKAIRELDALFHQCQSIVNGKGTHQQ